MTTVVSGIVLLITIAFTSGCPSSCICIPGGLHVICVNIGLSSVPNNIPSSTTDLFLATNSISSIQASDFTGLVKLKTLDLSDNIIETIDNDAFQPLTELTKLFIEHNKLQSLSPRHVQSLRKLVTLDISYNPYLSQLEQCILSPLDKLESLKLSRSPVMFGLYLFGNISSCSSYPCNALPDSKCHLPMLTELDISETLTDEVPVELFLLTPKLEMLSLARNGITTIPDDSFVGLTTLRQLSLNYNNLTNVNQRTLNGLMDLTKLELGNLGLQIEPDIFDILPNLAEISLTLLGQGVIDSLAPSVANTAVTKLNLNNNFLVSIPTSMSHISTITSLDLSQNDITHLPEREFSSSLKDIDLSYNSIDSLHQDAFDGLNQLETLELCYNALEIVPASVFDPIPQTTTICLGQNPWVCNCTMLPIIVDDRSHDTFPYPLCSSPMELSGRPFTVVDENDLNCIHTTIPTPTTTPTTTATTTASTPATTTASTPATTTTSTPATTTTSATTSTTTSATTSATTSTTATVTGTSTKTKTGTATGTAHTTITTATTNIPKVTIATSHTTTISSPPTAHTITVPTPSKNAPKTARLTTSDGSTPNSGHIVSTSSSVSPFYSISSTEDGDLTPTLGHNDPSSSISPMYAVSSSSTWGREISSTTPTTRHMHTTKATDSSNNSISGNNNNMIIIASAICFLSLVVALLTIAVFCHMYHILHPHKEPETHHYLPSLPSNEDIPNIYLKEVDNDNDNSEIYKDHGNYSEVSTNDQQYETRLPYVNTISDRVSRPDCVEMTHVDRSTHNTVTSTADKEPEYMEILF